MRKQRRFGSGNGLEPLGNKPLSSQCWPISKDQWVSSGPEKLIYILIGPTSMMNKRVIAKDLRYIAGLKRSCFRLSWWSHQMETFSALLALCADNSPDSGESPHKDQWRVALMLSLICAWITSWVNNREAGDLRRHRAHYDVTVMEYEMPPRYQSIRLCRYHKKIVLRTWLWFYNVQLISTNERGLLSHE